MNKIIVFGLGEIGKKVIDQCIQYAFEVDIVAIIDNNCRLNSYRDISVFGPERLNQLEFDEIWICTIYYHEIRRQLIEEYSISSNSIYYVEEVLPVLEERIRKKYDNVDFSKLDDEHKAVLSYLENNKLKMFCYPFQDEYFDSLPDVYFDDDTQMYYGIYEGKRIYFSKTFNTEKKAQMYYNAMLMEQDSRCPHCYWNYDNIAYAKGVGIDIGAAEGIFALKIINQVDHIFLIEIDDNWVEALKYTFRNYKSKVTIIHKYINDNNDDINVTLDSLFLDNHIDFIKMDIEGAEYAAIKGGENLFRTQSPDLAICIYHNRDDEQRISDFLKNIDYNITISKGLTICMGEWELLKNETDFRHALLFASKNMG